MTFLRIGIDLTSERAGPGGIHTYSNRLIEALARRAAPAGGSQPLEIIVFAHNDYPWLFPVEEHAAVRVVTSGRRGLGATARRIYQQSLVPRLARREGVHLLHSVNNVLPLALGVPGVVTVHDLSPFVIPRRFRLLKRGFLRWAVPRSIRRARCVVTDSEAVKLDILKWVPATRPEKIMVTGAAADARFSPAHDALAEKRLRALHGLPGEFVLTVGAGEPGKNLEGIARAFAMIHERDGLTPPWIIAGTARSLAPELSRLLDRLAPGQARLLGVVAADDLPHLYRMATVFLYPSLYEGFGLPLLEALASRTASITSDRSSMPEVAGRAAVRVNPDRPQAIARALSRLWRAPLLRERFAARGPERAAEFTWEKVASRTLHAYRQAIGQAVSKHEDRDWDALQNLPLERPLLRAPSPQRESSTLNRYEV